jgi:predicted SnoaL-like aldol condensation-catalyzing enzyme
VNEILKQIATIFSTGDTSSVASLFGEGYVDHQRPADLKALEGPEEFIAIVETVRKATPSLRVTLSGSVQVDDLMIGLLRWTGESLEERLTVEVLRRRDSLVVEHWGMKLRSGG